MALNNLERYSWWRRRRRCGACWKLTPQGLKFCCPSRHQPVPWPTRLRPTRLCGHTRRTAAAQPGAGGVARELCREIAAASDDAGLLRALRRFRCRQMLRIGANDHSRPHLEEVTLDLSDVADAAVVKSPWKPPTSPFRLASAPAERRRPTRSSIAPFWQARRPGIELFERHRSYVRLRRRGPDARQGRRHQSRGSITPAWWARWCGCCRRMPTAARPIASICDCGPKASRGLPRSLASALAYYDALAALGAAGSHQAVGRWRDSGARRRISQECRAVCLQPHRASRRSTKPRR